MYKISKSMQHFISLSLSLSLCIRVCVWALMQYINVKYEWWFLTMKISFVGFTTSCFFRHADFICELFLHRAFRKERHSECHHLWCGKQIWVGCFLFIAIFRDFYKSFHSCAKFLSSEEKLESLFWYASLFL